MFSPQTSFSKVYLMKGDLNDKELNKNPKILIPFDDVLN